MKSIARLVAIIRADFLVRFRRASTAIAFLLLSAFAYVWIPAPSTGRTLIQINGQRAIYNSGALGMGTASLGMMFVGLFGYYVISNSIRRDINSRCGIIAASTPMRSIEYLFGKFLGNVAFLITFLAGFMLSSMAMLLVRGEASLEPWIFFRQYLWLTPAAIVLVSAVAVLFESVSLLAGKLGDVAYFFLYLLFFGLVVTDEASGGGIRWARYFDFTGFGFMIHQMQHSLHTNSVSIGSSPFDPTKPALIFPGVSMTREWIAPRIVSTLLPLLLLPVAALLFHRFDPVRIGPTTGKTNRKWIGKVQSLSKPLTRRVVALLLVPARNGSFLAAIWSDAVLTFTLFPLAFLAFIGVTVTTLFAPVAAALPIVFAALAIIVSDVATRDLRAGTIASLYAVPRLRERYVWWKFGSALVISVIFCAMPIAVTAGAGLKRLTALFFGIIFIASIATLLAILTSNPKAFIVGFLSFWYIIVNDRGATPLLDFAGFYG
ncbi:MAG TPA: hypothetical protein VGI42_07965, partial [Chthoniobacterales bacterium]